MEIHRREVRVFQKSNGRAPFAEWLKDLKDGKARQIIKSRIDRIEQGNFGDFKFIGLGIFETKIHFGPGYRIYFGFDGPVLIIILCAGNKKSQKDDIRTAQNYWADYNGRGNE